MYLIGEQAGMVTAKWTKYLLFTQVSARLMVVPKILVLEALLDVMVQVVSKLDGLVGAVFVDGASGLPACIQSRVVFVPLIFGLRFWCIRQQEDFVNHILFQYRQRTDQRCVLCSPQGIWS